MLRVCSPVYGGGKQHSLSWARFTEKEREITFKACFSQPPTTKAAAAAAESPLGWRQWKRGSPGKEVVMLVVVVAELSWAVWWKSGMVGVERCAAVDCLIRCCIDFFELSSEEGRRRIFSCKSPNGPLGRIGEVRGSFEVPNQYRDILFSLNLIFTCFCSSAHKN